MTAAVYEVVIQRTGVAILTTDDEHHATAAAIFRKPRYGTLVVNRVIGVHRRKVWEPEGVGA